MVEMSERGVTGGQPGDVERKKVVHRKPSFAEITETVRDDVIRATSDYGLIKEMFFTLMNQQKLRDHYPWLVPRLYLAVTGEIIMTLSRLFETKRDHRKASLVMFLDGVERLPVDDADRLRERKRRYRDQIPAFQAEIESVEEKLVWYRNAYLAHNDLTKVDRVDIKWVELHSFIEKSQAILKGYFSAFEEADQRFEVVNLGWEPKQFLEWCRLDKYAEHHAAHVEKRRQELRRRIESYQTDGQTTNEEAGEARAAGKE